MPSDLSDRLTAVEDRIARAAAKCGRRREEITLLAVTKVFPAHVMLEAYGVGLREFGENYVQEFETKHDAVRSLVDARFHLIGHLQSNKSKRAAEIFHVVQTVDTPKLAKRLDMTRQAMGVGEYGKLDVFLEAKLSEEETKAGAALSSLPELVATVRGCPALQLRGVMAMPPWSDDPEPSRPYFRRLREIGERLGVYEFSMGMSHDFEVAIEEGSTMIRVGTALFGRRKKA